MELREREEMITRLGFMNLIGLLTAGIVMPSQVSQAKGIPLNISNIRYSCVWMGKEQIEREFYSPPLHLRSYIRDDGCWVSTLNYTMDGQDWYCTQFVDNLKDEPKVKEAFFRAMHRKYEAQRA